MPPGNPHVRRDIWSMEPDDPIVIAYGDAITAMQAKPASDPTSWTYQAAIHGTHANSPPPLANECRHQSWYFLPWHRMYLYYFERIVRGEVVAAGGPSDWALPFWDYDRDGTRTLPEAFRSPTRPDGSPNPLFVANRRPGINDGTLALSSTVTSAAFALSRPDFTGTTEFGGGSSSPAGQFKGLTGRVEQTPHNDIHVQIAGLMLDPDQAGLDPIFWLHHCNVDRLWWVWDDASRANPTDPAWADQTFEFFDEAGARVSLPCSGVGDIVSQLDYNYERRIRFPNLELRPEILELFRRRPPWPPWIRRIDLPIPGRPSPSGDSPEVVGGTDRAVSLVGDTEQVRVAVDARARRGAVGDAAPRQVVLDIENIDAERTPGTVYGVYVNLPDDPSEDDLRSHHAGNISLFGIERAREPRGDDHAHGAMQVSMDITDLARRLEARGEWRSEDVDVTFRPIPLDVVADAEGADAARDEMAQALHHGDDPITIGRVSVQMR
jgi:tyrosinase